MSDDNNFGAYVKNLRMELDLKQKEVAEVIGIEPSYLSKIEKGHFPPPSEDILFRMAAVLQVDSFKLIYKAGKIPPEFVELILNDPEVADYLLKKIEAKRST